MSRERWSAIGAGAGLAIMGRALGLGWWDWLGFSIGANLFVICAIVFWVERPDAAA